MLKNRETRRYIVTGIILTVLICAVVTIFHIQAWIGVAAAVAAMLFQYVFEVKRRYSHMENMAREIDLVLHGNDKVTFADYEEGDLSVLRNEVSKMTVMLRRQAERLSDEKVKLADSLADISHQIRTPLTSLNLMLESLKSEENDDERARIIFDMRRQLERIDGLVVSLLKLAKMDAGTIKLQKAPVELGALVRSALEPIEIMLELKGIAVNVDVKGTYTGDKEWSRVALTNILKNCMEHTDDGGVISITGCENAVHTELVIQDTGAGIAKDDLPHIFERFYKGQNSKNDSYGIGLALARSIIAGENGTIKAENVISTDGYVCGARFIMRFYKSIV